LLLAPLVVQAQASPPGVHVVQAGDTLSQIALDANTDADTIATLNGLDNTNTLSIGQSLKLPSIAAGASSTPVAGARSTVAPTTSNSGSYTVAEGDTLWDIAQRLGTTSDALVQVNHLDDPDHLALGTVLSVPGAATARAASVAATTVTASASPASASTPQHNVFVSYTVQPGETLNQIARQFEIRSDLIVQASNLDDPNKLSVGSVLKVPVPAREHVVNPGETLRDIAASEKVDLGSLIDFNQLDDPALIRVGQVVLLPVAANQQVAASTTSPSSAQPVPPAPAPAPAPAQPAPAPPPPAARAAPAPPTAAPLAPAATTAATPAPTPKPAPAATPSASPASATAAAAAAKPTAAAPKPAAPVTVVAPPPGAPSDGLAGAGLKLLGSPYAWGGASPSGFDCSGFVWYVARQVGRPLSRSMLGQYNSGSHPARDQLQVGDLVFFQNTFSPGLSHNGVYIGNNQFVNAADEAAGVTISNLNTAYWSSHWFGATRLP
jgi:cell wall-associated NlpC family hydrolase/nucleoid-associated protein YgaU